MGMTPTPCIYFITPGFFWHLHFFFPPATSSYTVAFVISLVIAPLFLFHQRNLPSDWGITYSEKRGGTEPPPTVCVYLWAEDMRASIRGGAPREQLLLLTLVRLRRKRRERKRGSQTQVLRDAPETQRTALSPSQRPHPVANQHPTHGYSASCP